MRGEIDNIYHAIAALSVKVSDPAVKKPWGRIGFKTSNDK